MSKVPTRQVNFSSQGSAAQEKIHGKKRAMGVLTAIAPAGVAGLVKGKENLVQFLLKLPVSPAEFFPAGPLLKAGSVDPRNILAGPAVQQVKPEMKDPVE
jgi:hypothetical protein